MDVLRFLMWCLNLTARALHGLGKGMWWLARQTLRRRSTTFGSARWASLWHLMRGGALGDKGLIIGKAWGRLLRFNGDGAVLVAAPMGSGKGVGIVVPNLLDYRGSIICTDPKGENEGVTSKHRESLGPVYRLSAIHPEISDSFNPLDMVRLNTASEFEDALMLADLLVVPEGSDGHWDTSAKQVMAAAIMYTLRTRAPVERTLATVGNLMNAEANTLKETFTAMAAWPEPSIAEQGRTALRGLEFPEFNSVMANTSKALRIWAADRIGGRLSMQSSFDLMDVHRHTLTVYVMVPEELLAVYAPYLRVMMGCANAALVRGKYVKRPEHKPLLLIDECQTLGRLEALERGMGIYREYARVILIFQDLGRMRALYGEDGANSFVAASGAQVLFSINDLRTAKDASDMLGALTVQTRSQGQSQANTDLMRRQEQAGVSEAGRALLDPSEILRLSPTKAIIRMNTVRAPVLARKIKYYKERRWRGLWERWRDVDPVSTPAPMDAAAPPPTPPDPTEPPPPVKVAPTSHEGRSAS